MSRINVDDIYLKAGVNGWANAGPAEVVFPNPPVLEAPVIEEIHEDNEDNEQEEEEEEEDRVKERPAAVRFYDEPRFATKLKSSMKKQPKRDEKYPIYEPRDPQTDETIFTIYSDYSITWSDKIKDDLFLSFCKDMMKHLENDDKGRNLLYRLTLVNSFNVLKLVKANLTNKEILEKVEKVIKETEDAFQ